MEPRDLIERRLLVDRAAIRRYADITQDYNPIHLDPTFAARTPMGGIIAYGTMSLNLVWQSLAATFGMARMADIALDIRFIRPVREGDTVVSGGSLKAVGTYDVWVRAERTAGEEIVIAGTVTLDAAVRGLTDLAREWPHAPPRP